MLNGFIVIAVVVGFCVSCDFFFKFEKIQTKKQDLVADDKINSRTPTKKSFTLYKVSSCSVHSRRAGRIIKSKKENASKSISIQFEHVFGIQVVTENYSSIDRYTERSVNIRLNRYVNNCSVEFL